MTEAEALLAKLDGVRFRMHAPCVKCHKRYVTVDNYEKFRPNERLHRCSVQPCPWSYWRQAEDVTCPHCNSAAVTAPKYWAEHWYYLDTSPEAAPRAEATIAGEQAP